MLARRLIVARATHRAVQLVPVPIVFQCERCPQYHTVLVCFEDGEEPIVRLMPDNCSCGEMLDTPHLLRDVIGTARMLVETAEYRRRTS